MAVDLGHVNDDRDQLRERLDHAQENVDVLLTSGGPAGDEDHLSALLSETGSIEFWRIAVKPGVPWRWVCGGCRYLACLVIPLRRQPVR